MSNMVYSGSRQFRRKAGFHVDRLPADDVLDQVNHRQAAYCRFAARSLLIRR
jgi:hypothetical protein